jgi:hypothetical protein
MSLKSIFLTNGQTWRDTLPRESDEWYAFSHLADANLKTHRHLQTVFVKFSPDPPHREMRKASFVRPDVWRTTMSQIHEMPITVSDEESLLVWLLLGGEALVESSMAAKLFPEYLRVHEVGRTATYGGWIGTNSVPSTALRHAPTPKLRAKVLLRDNRRCRLCGRSPDQDPHAFLEAHHGIGWGARKSGLTVEENLFALCKTCHAGITNELEFALLANILPPSSSMVQESLQQYRTGVYYYRKSVLRSLKTGQQSH